MAKAMPVPLCPLPKLQSTCLKHYTFFHFQHFQTPALFQQSDLSLMKKRLQFLVWFYSVRIYPPSSVQLQYFRENLFMIQPTWLNVHFQAITFLLSELLSNTVSLQPQRLERTENDRVHSTFREKRIHSTSVSELLISAKQQAESQHNFVKRSSSPFWVMKRHHLVDVALCERLHQLAEKIPV